MEQSWKSNCTVYTASKPKEAEGHDIEGEVFPIDFNNEQNGGYGADSELLMLSMKDDNALRSMRLC